MSYLNERMRNDVIRDFLKLTEAAYHSGVSPRDSVAIALAYISGGRRKAYFEAALSFNAFSDEPNPATPLAELSKSLYGDKNYRDRIHRKCRQLFGDDILRSNGQNMFSQYHMAGD